MSTSAKPTTPPVPPTPETAKDALLKQVTQIITSEVPDIADNVKVLLEKDFKGKLSSYLEGLRRTGKSTVDDVLKNGTDILAKMKKELAEMVSDIKEKKMTEVEAANKAINDFLDAMNIDPKFKDVLLNLVKYKDDIAAEIAEGKKVLAEIEEKQKNFQKNKSDIVISYATLVKIVVSVMLSVAMLVSYVWSTFFK
jgi:hypothetical protein